MSEQEKNAAVFTSLDEDRLYWLVAYELENGKRDAELWKQSVTRCNGIESDAMPVYIKLRERALKIEAIGLDAVSDELIPNEAPVDAGQDLQQAGSLTDSAHVDADIPQESGQSSVRLKSEQPKQAETANEDAVTDEAIDGLEKPELSAGSQHLAGTPDRNGDIAFTLHDSEVHADAELPETPLVTSMVEEVSDSEEIALQDQKFESFRLDPKTPDNIASSPDGEPPQNNGESPVVDSSNRQAKQQEKERQQRRIRDEKKRQREFAEAQKAENDRNTRDMAKPVAEALSGGEKKRVLEERRARTRVKRREDRQELDNSRLIEEARRLQEEDKLAERSRRKKKSKRGLFVSIVSTFLFVVVILIFLGFAWFIMGI